MTSISPTVGVAIAGSTTKTHSENTTKEPPILHSMVFVLESNDHGSSPFVRETGITLRSTCASSILAHIFQ
jgi:hypothetical protein